MMIEQPGFIFDQRKKNKKKFLLVCYYDPAGISTVPEIIAYIQKLSAFPVVVANIFECRDPAGINSLPSNINLSEFSGIIIHNSISYDVVNLRVLDARLSIKLKDFNGLKILLKQDENHKFRELAEYVGQTRFDLILTCLPSSEIEKIYPKDVVGEVKFQRMFTGYVTPTLRAINAKPLNQREITIGYRGSIQPLSFGRLAYEKRSIGEKVICDLNGVANIRLDISSKWEDRLGTDAWFDFLGNCKATLGAESGASVFDIDGSLKSKCTLAEQTLGVFREDADYAESYLKYIVDLEGTVNYNQISPRHFEAAATRTLQLLYPGEYSGIFLPGIHYLELARDHSNILEVISFLQNDAAVMEITEQAHKDIVMNPSFWIEGFVAMLDKCIEELLSVEADISQLSVSENEKKQVMLLCSHPAQIDPRIDWVEKYAPDNMLIHVVDILRDGELNFSVVTHEDGSKKISTPRIKFTSQLFLKWQRLLSGSSAGTNALFQMTRIEKLASSSDSELAKFMGMPDNAKRLNDFRWYLRFVLEINTGLLESCLATSNVQCLIATDLVTLPAAVLYGAIENIPVHYDAHEYWPASDTRQFQSEQEFWLDLEKNLIKYTTDRSTVSPGLKEVFEKSYGLNFRVVPNCEPLKNSSDQKFRAKIIGNEICNFLFQGSFAPHRGLEELISIWVETDPSANLILRGPANSFKTEMINLAKSTGLFESRIFFPDAVSEGQLVEMASAADVGIIPYKAHGYNYAHCCPNKLSQYMAAEIPILANNTSFVANVIREAKSGLVVDFSNKKSLLNAIAEFGSDGVARREMGKAGKLFHEKKFNWQNASANLYEALDNLILKPTKRVEIFTASLSGSIEESNKVKCVQAVEVLERKFLRSLMPFWLALPLRVRDPVAPILKRILGV
ncbi:glycosyltransferase [Acidovorax sp. SUPP3334]|uniref:glycosyltransferase n=1 Tax=Acidovorax sp. SUPP3334 TaxID=2920881 RepID=UPI0023DE4DBF|nr:glycosyltransferase [Acidovorax sp. SUPP3334]GKT21342.1 hypothetical protein AVHM3334_04455 [Acidovorax sp. SUPP3334]